MDFSRIPSSMQSVLRKEVRGWAQQAGPIYTFVKYVERLEWFHSFFADPISVTKLKVDQMTRCVSDPSAKKLKPLELLACDATKPLPVFLLKDIEPLTTEKSTMLLLSLNM